MKIRGLVLAGGKSSRFGRDKALAVYQGETLLERAVNLLEAVDLRPVVVTRRGADYPFLRCPVLRDKLPELGPLGGIYTAMSVFKNSGFLVLTCDMPAMSSSALLQLLADRKTEEITVFTHDFIPQPFPGVYSSALFGPIGQRLVRGDLSMAGLLEGTAEKKMSCWTGDAGIFLNVNRMDDLPSTAARLESSLSHGGLPRFF